MKKHLQPTFSFDQHILQIGHLYDYIGPRLKLQRPCYTWLTKSLRLQQSLQEVFHKGMTLNEAIKHSMSILKQVMEEKLSETNVEVATITKADGFKLMDGQKLQSHIKELS